MVSVRTQPNTPGWRPRRLDLQGRPITPIVVVDGEEFKDCADCNTRFPVEWNSRGQRTTRRLCDACREKRARRSADDLPSTNGVPRCSDCSALLGLDWGTVTHLDSEGRCPSCQRWAEKAEQCRREDAAGIRRAGGLKFQPRAYPQNQSSASVVAKMAGGVPIPTTEPSGALQPHTRARGTGRLMLAQASEEFALAPRPAWQTAEWAQARIGECVEQCGNERRELNERNGRHASDRLHLEPDIMRLKRAICSWLWLSGWTLQKIGDLFGQKHETVLNMLSRGRYGPAPVRDREYPWYEQVVLKVFGPLPDPSATRKENVGGGAHPALPLATGRAVLERIAAGGSRRKVAAELGVSWRTVGRIVAGAGHWAALHQGEAA